MEEKRSVIVGRDTDLIDSFKKAGLLPEYTRRIVIDIPHDDVVTMYYECVADTRILDINLAGQLKIVMEKKADEAPEEEKPEWLKDVNNMIAEMKEWINNVKLAEDAEVAEAGREMEDIVLQMKEAIGEEFNRLLEKELGKRIAFLKTMDETVDVAYKIEEIQKKLIVAFKE